MPRQSLPRRGVRCPTMRRKPGDRIATSWRTRIVPRALACPMNTRERPPFSRPNIAPVRPSSFDWMPRERHTRARATRFSHLTGSHSLQVARRLAATPVRGERVTGPQNSSSGAPSLSARRCNTRLAFANIGTSMPEQRAHSSSTRFDLLSEGSWHSWCPRERRRQHVTGPLRPHGLATCRHPFLSESVTEALVVSVLPAHRTVRTRRRAPIRPCALACSRKVRCGVWIRRERNVFVNAPRRGQSRAASP